MLNIETKHKAVLFPYEPSNPYQPNLIKALNERGFTAEGVKDSSLGTLIESSKDQDILHLHWAHPYLLTHKLYSSIYTSMIFFKFLIIQKIKGRKLIWTIHNLLEHEPRHPVFERLCYRILARLADGIIVHSQYARERVQKTYWLNSQTEKLCVIPHGNYIENYPNDISREQARTKLGIGLEKRAFLFFGQIRSYKGLPELISAFTKAAKGKGVLIIAGKPLDEKIKTELSLLTSERADIKFFPGFVADSEIQTFMNAADAVVFSFRDIFTSGSALLAMSFSKAMIVPDLQSLKDITSFGGSITYDSKQTDGLETALLNAISNDLELLGARNLEAAKIFSWESIGEKTEKLYNKVLSVEHRQN